MIDCGSYRFVVFGFFVFVPDFFGNSEFCDSSGVNYRRSVDDVSGN